MLVAIFLLLYFKFVKVNSFLYKYSVIYSDCVAIRMLITYYGNVSTHLLMPASKVAMQYSLGRNLRSKMLYWINLIFHHAMLLFSLVIISLIFNHLLVACVAIYFRRKASVPQVCNATFLVNANEFFLLFSFRLHAQLLIL